MEKENCVGIEATNCPKDLPIIARTAGKLAGRAIGYVQLARGQFDTIMHQTQARQVHKELQDTIAQLEAIRHEIRTVSFMNPGPLTRRLVDNLDQTSAASAINSESVESNEVINELTDESRICQKHRITARSQGNHKSVMVIRRNQVVGGITYRPYVSQMFGEIAFCAITADEQVKGYGTRLMNHLKQHARDVDRLTHFLTYADNNAVGYFIKRDWSFLFPFGLWFSCIWGFHLFSSRSI
ncbi:hypothetical protein TEA_021723 [Camellia sinensis var. sinensis]|uniref:N-acetyltransferase domain-containing protein n=1 Tax=Camellia sinensis var. sinensis TaxID=542762 RepID=A0A4S4DZI7_CAMSN|nr:hypothetical protein TEA_021723 [Camellia sinensis var. sinensis]